ncbi:hypothetical protein PR048_016473 [Dryococelus australis]|uniref:Uncharacterized protein n=1 Tax=Dryococelus australis TaxID=614101 RepID=A0ABQ9HKD5_9NEOP|nr:hypothetical protein PR048_016473 [Dryococelus australis]
MRESSPQRRRGDVIGVMSAPSSQPYLWTLRHRKTCPAKENGTTQLVHRDIINSIAVQDGAGNIDPQARPVNDVAAIFVGDVPPMRNDIRTYPKDRPAQFIRPLNVLADPMTYLICTHMANMGARLNFSILHHSGKSFQQFVVNAYCKAESFRIWFIRQCQVKKRVNEYLDLQEHRKSVVDDAQSTVGK